MFIHEVPSVDLGAISTATIFRVSIFVSVLASCMVLALAGRGSWIGRGFGVRRLVMLLRRLRILLDRFALLVLP